MKGGNKAWKTRHDQKLGLLKVRFRKKKKEERI